MHIYLILFNFTNTVKILLWILFFHVRYTCMFMWMCTDGFEPVFARVWDQSWTLSVFLNSPYFHCSFRVRISLNLKLMAYSMPLGE